MKKVILLALTGLALVAQADAVRPVDPFNASSCRGMIMSSERALELLGPYSQVNLATHDDVETSSSTKVYYRFRNKIGNRKGPWFPSQLDTFSARPMLSNSEGALNFNLDVDVSGSGTTRRAGVPCTIRNSFELSCVIQGETVARWGSGTFAGTITNNCLRLTSSASTRERDEEWVYYMPIL